MPITPSSTPNQTEARALRDQLNTQYPPESDPPEVGEWRAYMSPLGFWRVDRETSEGLECAAAHCWNQAMAKRIAEMLNSREKLA
jgi:hypothetical protein